MAEGVEPETHVTLCSLRTASKASLVPSTLNLMTLNKTKESLAELFKQQRKDASLLSQSELLKVGGARGVQSKDVFLLPLLLLMLVVVIVLCLLCGGLCLLV